MNGPQERGTSVQDWCLDKIIDTQNTSECMKTAKQECYILILYIINLGGAHGNLILNIVKNVQFERNIY